MNTPDPNNPQPGDQFVNDMTVTWEVRAIDGAAVWVINPDNGGRCTTTLGTVATWTPVTTTPADLWGHHLPNGAVLPCGSKDDALRGFTDGDRIARYTFAEWVTP